MDQRRAREMPVVSTAVDQDQLAIMERMSRYAWGYDSTDVEMLQDSFTSDASFSMYLEGASSGDRIGAGT